MVSLKFKAGQMKIIFIVLLSIVLYADYEIFPKCSIHRSYEDGYGAIEVECTEAECIDSIDTFVKKTLHSEIKKLKSRIPEKSFNEFLEVQKEWRNYVDENMYEYAVIVGGYPSCIETASKEFSMVLQRIAEIKYLAKFEGRCRVDDLECLKSDYKIADKELNDIYKKLMHKLAKTKRYALRDVQRLWIKSTERQCEFFYPYFKEYFDDNEQKDIEYYSCKVRLTKDRVGELKDILGAIK
jgi:uncharacterized protein YecT (DUF1311 family)